MTPDIEELNQLAMVVLWMDLNRHQRLEGLSGRLDGLHASPGGTWTVVIGDRTVTLEVAGVGGYPQVAVDMRLAGRSEVVTVTGDWRPGEPIWSGSIGGTPRVIQCRAATAGVRLLYRGIDIVARVMTPRVAALAALMPEKTTADSSSLVRCPMPGLVVAINVAVGQEVKAGEAVAVIEAMKMENVLRAERDATVAKVNVSPGDILAVDEVIAEFE